MNKHVLSGLAAVGLIAALPSAVSSAGANSETVKADWAGTYEIPEQVAALEELGELGQINHGCNGLYFLADGTAKLDGTMTFTPSQEAYEDNELGATMELSVKNKYTGLWAISPDDSSFPYTPSEHFVLRDNGIRVEVLFEVREVDEAGLSVIGPVPVSEEFRWQGEFMTADTRETVENWRYKITVTEGELDETSIIEDTCGGI